ncbi:MAG: helix-turn-helix transcriptional regulator [Acidimicrobiales bacterium]|jgi:transcriptional regulator with XRE-family HTH domain
MSGEAGTGVDDIVRRNIAALRAKANLTQQGLADEMLLRGIGWTRETVAQVETTNRRIGLTEAIAVAACLDVPLARLVTTGADSVAVGDGRWSTAYLAAAIAGTAGDVFPPESYATPTRGIHEDRQDRWPDEDPAARASAASTAELERRRRPRDRSLIDPTEAGSTPDSRAPIEVSDAPQKAAERIERRLRLRVTAGDVDDTAQQLWSRSLEAERERRVTDRHSLTGGSLPTIRGHVSRDLDRELAHEMGKRTERATPPGSPSAPLTADEAAWEATRLNIILANKGYSDSDVTRWWNFTRHRELDDQTIAEAWRDGRYTAVSRLIQSLPDQQDVERGASGSD